MAPPPSRAGILWLLASGLCWVAAMSTLVAMTTATPAAAHDPVDRRLVRLDQAIAADPAQADLHLQRAEAHRLRGDFEPALADLDRALDLGGGPEVYFFRGRVLLEAGHPTAARAELERFLTTDTTSDRLPAARILTAETAIARGELHRATNEYLAAIRSDSALQPQTYLDCARIATAAARPPEALECLDTGINRLGPSTALLARAVPVEIALGRIDRALLRLGRLDNAEPAAGRWSIERGEVLARLGRRREARDAYVDALGRIESLPASRRRIPAIVTLEQKARTGLDRLAAVSEPGR